MASIYTLSHSLLSPSHLYSAVSESQSESESICTRISFHLCIYLLSTCHTH